MSSIIWKRLQSPVPSDTEPKRLVWALLLLKVYGTSPVNRAITESDERTVRYWTKYVLEALQSLNLVSSV